MFSSTQELSPHGTMASMSNQGGSTKDSLFPQKIIQNSPLSQRKTTQETHNAFALNAVVDHELTTSALSWTLHCVQLAWL